MMLNRTARRGVPLLALSVALLVLASARPVHALPSGGTDEVQISAQVSLTSRLGQETIAFTGTATFERSDPYNDGGFDTVDMEMTSLSLSGDSVTGPVTITQRSSTPSLGQLRGTEAGQAWPAYAYLDAFVDVGAPASPDGTITKHNNDAIRVEPMFDGEPLPISSWPPTAVPWSADLASCVPLHPVDPKGVCVTGLSMTMSGDPAGVGGVSELPVLTAEAGGLERRLVVVIGAIGVALVGAAAWFIGRRLPS